MITDLILTQAAALLATIQLNCTAPQIQVVDELPALVRQSDEPGPKLSERPADKSGRYHGGIRNARSIS